MLVSVDVVPVTQNSVCKFFQHIRNIGGTRKLRFPFYPYVTHAGNSYEANCSDTNRKTRPFGVRKILVQQFRRLVNKFTSVTFTRTFSVQLQSSNIRHYNITSRRMKCTVKYAN